MPSFFSRLQNLVSEPPPDFLFEITERSLAAVSPQEPSVQRQEILPERAAVASPASPNLTRVQLFREALARVAPGLPGKRTATALVIPDYAVRMAIVDLEEFPTSDDDRLALLRFRLRKAVPFPIEDAQLSYSVQRTEPKQVEVLTVAIAKPILDEYESLLRTVGFRIGRVMPSSLAALRICPKADRGLTVLAKIAGDTFSVVLLEGSLVRLVRCLDLTGDEAQEDSAVFPALQQTLAYAEDHLRMPVTRVSLCGFGTDTERISARVHAQLGLPCAPLRSKYGIPSQVNAGLLGLLEQYAG